MQLVLLIAALLLCLSPLFVRSVELRPKQVLVVVIDGFRQDYLDRFHFLASFRALRERSTRVPAFIPEMPTHCFPNFYSFFTGRVPLDHGIVANNMLDASTGRQFLGGVSGDWSDAIWWNRSEPLWVSTKRHGKRVALFLWPTCDLSIFPDVYRPDRCEPYRELGNEFAPSTEQDDIEVAQNNDSSAEPMDTPRIRQSALRFADSLKKAVDELRNGTQFVGVFTDLVDILGHVYGPESELLGDALRRELDPAILWLLEALDRPAQWNGASMVYSLSETVNVVLLSDHGMAPLLFDVRANRSTDSPDAKPRIVDLRSLWKYSEVLQTFDGGAYVGIYPAEHVVKTAQDLELFVQRVRRKLRPAQREAVKFVTRDDLIAQMHAWDVADLHFTNEPELQIEAPTHTAVDLTFVDPVVRGRVAPLVALAEPGWFLITSTVQHVPHYADRPARGWHGYHSRHAHMWGLFLAFGPAFTPGRVVSPQQNDAVNWTGYLRARDAYLLLAELVGVQPLPCNASRERVSHVVDLTPTQTLAQAQAQHALPGTPSRSDSATSSAVKLLFLVATILVVLAISSAMLYYTCRWCKVQLHSMSVQKRVTCTTHGDCCSCCSRLQWTVGRLRCCFSNHLTPRKSRDSRLALTDAITTPYMGEAECEVDGEAEVMQHNTEQMEVACPPTTLDSQTACVTRMLRLPQPDTVADGVD